MSLRSVVAEKAARYGPANYFDRLKLFALLTMTVDHIGLCLMPESDMLRAIGRTSMPLWMFLIGYHTACAPEGKDWRRHDRELILSALLLMAVQIAVSRPFLPLLMPISILLARRTLLWPAFRRLAERQPMGAFAVAAVLILPTLYFIEYGSVILLFALLGWWVAKGEDTTTMRVFAIFAAATYAALENLLFAFAPMEEWLVYVGVALVTFVPLETRPGEWRWMQRHPFIAASTLFLTRNSLFYYTAHLAVLRLVGAMLYPSENGWHFRLF